MIPNSTLSDDRPPRRSACQALAHCRARHRQSNPIATPAVQFNQLYVQGPGAKRSVTAITTPGPCTYNPLHNPNFLIMPSTFRACADGVSFIIFHSALSECGQEG